MHSLSQREKEREIIDDTFVSLLQVFIAYSAQGTQHLGKVPHETPFGVVVEGMDVVDKFFDG